MRLAYAVLRQGARIIIGEDASGGALEPRFRARLACDRDAAGEVCLLRVHRWGGAGAGAPRLILGGLPTRRSLPETFWRPSMRDHLPLYRRGADVRARGPTHLQIERRAWRTGSASLPPEARAPARLRNKWRMLKRARLSCSTRKRALFIGTRSGGAATREDRLYLWAIARDDRHRGPGTDPPAVAPISMRRKGRGNAARRSPPCRLPRHPASRDGFVAYS